MALLRESNHLVCAACPDCGAPLELGHDCLAGRPFEPEGEDDDEWD